MKTTYKVINEDLFRNVIEINIEELTTDGQQFFGTVHLNTSKGFKMFTGYHSSKDYLNDYGFKLVSIED